jgi:hypothetical protein
VTNALGGNKGNARPLEHVHDSDDPSRDVLARRDRYAGPPCVADRERCLAVITNFGETRLDARALAEVVVVTDRIRSRVAITIRFEDVLAEADQHGAEAAEHILEQHVYLVKVVIRRREGARNRRGESPGVPMDLIQRGRFDEAEVV